jgi:hypothetical protein
MDEENNEEELDNLGPFGNECKYSMLLGDIYTSFETNGNFYLCQCYTQTYKLNILGFEVETDVETYRPFTESPTSLN